MRRLAAGSLKNLAQFRGRKSDAELEAMAKRVSDAKAATFPGVRVRAASIIVDVGGEKFSLDDLSCSPGGLIWGKRANEILVFSIHTIRSISLPDGQVWQAR